jgi:hypothetical protein
MASILDRYGIKEVADVTFYKINDDGSRGIPVLYLDTLKVSTIEQTAETTDARGGKGNPKLVTWDYGKDITVTLEDALFSAKSLAIMFGNGTVDSSAGVVTRTVMVRAEASDNGVTGILPAFFTADVYDAEKMGAVRKKVYFNNANIPSNAVYYGNAGITIKTYTSEDGTKSEASFDKLRVKAGEKVFITYEIKASKKEIVVSADTFPGNYYVTGDTYARSDVNGEDQFFQFIIQKAKVTSENTITLEAEGDPSVFNMNLSVLRPEDGEMMKLVQYDLIGEEKEVLYADKTLLLNAIEIATPIYDEGNLADAVKWTDDSWAAFANAYDAANGTYASAIEKANQKDVDDAEKALTDAMKALALKPAN